MHLLSTRDMGQADKLTMQGGCPGTVLMQNAAQAVADVIRQVAAPDRPIRILCGPGNNGGDGYALGAILAAEWREVIVFGLGTPQPGSDAAWAREKWGRTVEPLAAFRPDGSALIVDALFGAGLSRDLDGEAAEAVDRANAASATVVAIDVPSGIGGDDGRIHGKAVRADHTVTFFRGKPGHWLYPGRAHRGALHIRDIGIDDGVLDTIGSRFRLNDPSFWADTMPRLKNDTHKYERGAALVLSGDALSTGASRLAALAAARAGAGAVTILAPPEAARVHAVHLTSVMIDKASNGQAALKRVLKGRERALVAGPGYGVGAELKQIVLDVLLSERETGRMRTIVLDADALTSFRDKPDALFDAIAASDCSVVLTPHDGEFARLFPDLAEADLAKTRKASDAADRSGATILLKGPDTVIAEPDGRIAINPNGTPLLATAGAGDVLAGMIAGLAAQKMPVFEAACAAVWLHAEAARRFGPGLTADDLPDQLPHILRQVVSREGASR